MDNDNGWISVKDSKPDEGKEVLIWITFYTDSPIIAYLSGDGEWYGSYQTRDCMVDGYVKDSQLISIPTHWMPLPSPPKTSDKS